MPHSHHHSVHHAAPHSTGCLGLLGHCSAPWDDVAQAQPARGEVALQRWHSGRLLHPGGNGQRKRADRTPGALKGFCESLSFPGWFLLPSMGTNFSHGGAVTVIIEE